MKKKLSYSGSLLIFLTIIFFNTCQKRPKSNPLYVNSIVSTDIDFIKSTDFDAFINLTYVGQGDKEMVDSRTDNLFDSNTFIFKAFFLNNQKVEIWAHSSFGSQSAAQEYVEKLTHRLGKLPEFMRDKLSHVVLHKGDAGAFSDAEGHFIILYSENIDVRISNNDLEETIFHETIHASLDETYAKSNEWKKAQKKDNVFLTEYGQEYPTREDLAETAIFSYTMIKHPGRLSSETEQWIRENTPNRLAFFKTIF